MLLAIDLGTTHSLAAIWQNGQAVLIPNALGEMLTPSAVSVNDNDEVLVGRAARDRWLTNPATGAVTFKRYMGSSRQLPLAKRSYRPEELSALVLKSLKADAERYLGEPLSEAVITVPAYFSDAQRKATRLAGELAGLKVLRLLNEPTAAALAYGLQEAALESTFLVLDLGGGTFDVSILERFDGLMEVRASTGDNFLGGEDFVDALLALVRQQLPGLPADDCDSLLRARLWREGERVKRALGAASMETFSLEWQGQTHACTVSVGEFEAACATLLQRFRRPIERALRDAKLDAAQLDQVVLAGGATRMPMIRRLVALLFGRMPAMNLNPDEVIARGAAVLTGLLAGDVALHEIVMTDVCPYTLGTSICRRLDNGSYRDGFFDPIIERNTVLPVSRENSYVTMRDDQAQIEIDVYQGEARLSKDNILLGTVAVPVPPRPAGAVEVLVRFTYDSSGILECEVKVPATQRVERLVLKGTPNDLSEAEIAERLAALARLKIHPREQQINLATLAHAERLHEELLGSERRAFAEHVLHFETALASQDMPLIARERLALEALMDRVERGLQW